MSAPVHRAQTLVLAPEIVEPVIHWCKTPNVVPCLQNRFQSDVCSCLLRLPCTMNGNFLNCLCVVALQGMPWHTSGIQKAASDAAGKVLRKKPFSCCKNV